MDIFNLRQEIRTMNISIHNDYRNTVQPIENKGRQVGLLLRRCRADLDAIADVWSKSTT